MVVMCIAVRGSQTPLTALSVLPRRVTSRPPSADRHGTGSQLTLFPAQQVFRDSVLILSNN